MQNRAGRDFGNTRNSVDLRQLMSDSFSVLLAGFLTGGNGLLLIGVESVCMQILRPASLCRWP